MPRIVDHAQRREVILEASWRVIARLGLDDTTMREIARESGFSLGTLAHYFADKDDILVSALVLAHDRVRARVAARLAGLDGLAALRALMEEALPLDGLRLLEATIEVSFWGRALATPRLLATYETEVTHLRETLRRLVVGLGEGVDVVRAVDELMLLIDGLSMQTVMFPAQMTPARQLRRLDELLDRLVDGA